MGRTMSVYTSGSTATTATQPQTELQHQFAWVRVGDPDPYVPDELAAEIRLALAAVERGEIEDLGDFSQFVDDED